MRSPDASDTSRSAEVPPISTVIFMIEEECSERAERASDTAAHSHRRSVCERARSAPLETPAGAARRKHATRHAVAWIARANDAHDLATRRSAPFGGIDRSRDAHHHVRDIAALGEPNFAELDGEKSISPAVVERGVHLRTTRPCDARENTAAAELLTEEIHRRRITRLRQTYFGSHRAGIDSGMTHACVIDNADPLGYDARVDRDRTRLRAVLYALAPDASVREKARHGGATGQREQRDVVREVAHANDQAGTALSTERRGQPWAAVWGNDESVQGA
jgi:hypothetical protein